MPPSLLKHKDEIEMLLRVNNIDILALNETKIDETISSCYTEIDGYNHERFDRNRHLERFLYVHQSGFRSKHSSETSLLNTTNQLCLNIDRSQYNIVVFIDLHKAIDTVNSDILLCKLYHYGIKNTEMKWFKSYLSNRRQCCSIPGHDSKFSCVTTGILQGSSLSPLLFLVYVNDLPNAVRDSLTGMYANDTSLYSTGPSISAMEETMYRDLLKLFFWLLANKLSTNTVKIKFMVIAPPYNMSKLADKPEIKVLGTSLEQVTSIDYPGMTMDQYLR